MLVSQWYELKNIFQQQSFRHTVCVSLHETKPCCVGHHRLQGDPAQAIQPHRDIHRCKCSCAALLFWLFFANSLFSEVLTAQCC